MKVLVISVHPDDETMGCGGSILKHREEGEQVFWLILTRAFEPQWSKEEIQRKTEEVEKVSGAYGFEQVYWLKFPTTQLDAIPQRDLMDGISGVAREVRPQWVYIVNRSDSHSDHRAGFEASQAVFRPFHRDLGIQKILGYEALSSTDAAPALPERVFLPNVFTDITPYLERKVEIMNLYETEVQPDPLPRSASSIRALARVRGATIGAEYAEAFMLLLELN